MSDSVSCAELVELEWVGVVGVEGIRVGGVSVGLGWM